MAKLPYLSHDPQELSAQYLEDLATGYWFSEALFTAVEMEIFSQLEPEGKTLSELVDRKGLNPEALKRFLSALCALGLLFQSGETYFNSQIARRFLVKGRKEYQGNSILWRKYLWENWQSLASCLKKGTRVKFSPEEEDPEDMNRRFRRYSRAMDCIARNKAGEILKFFTNSPLSGNILDVGSGTGSISVAFLDQFPDIQATLLDLPQVLDFARELHEKEYGNRINYRPTNILQPWPVPENGFDLVILSNIVHAYAKEEIAQLLERAVACLKTDGILLIHDFFFEHYSEKAALFDLNMLVNTYNGQVFSARWVREELKKQRMTVTDLLPLESDTALLIAAFEKDRLDFHC